jgi:hypothetical protein
MGLCNKKSKLSRVILRLTNSSSSGAHINVKLGRAHLATVAVEKQNYYVF